MVGSLKWNSLGTRIITSGIEGINMELLRMMLSYDAVRMGIVLGLFASFGLAVLAPFVGLAVYILKQ